MATCAPSCARARAVAAPMPREPPVTSATLPASFLDMGRLLVFVVTNGRRVYRLVPSRGGLLTGPVPVARTFSEGAIPNASGGLLARRALLRSIVGDKKPAG